RREWLPVQAEARLRFRSNCRSACGWCARRPPRIPPAETLPAPDRWSPNPSSGHWRYGNPPGADWRLEEHTRQDDGEEGGRLASHLQSTIEWSGRHVFFTSEAHL